MSDRESSQMVGLTEEERLLIQRVRGCAVRAQRYITVGVTVVGLVFGACVLVVAVVARDQVLRDAAVFTLMFAPVLGIVRWHILNLYSIIQKLSLDLESLRTVGSEPLCGKRI